jgi:3-oxoacyl-[acyl-carrier protein] reductase
MTQGPARHVALVTGANHGIGAATAEALAANGSAVVCTCWRIDDPLDPAVPGEYRINSAQSADAVVEAIREHGGEAVAIAEDLTDPTAPRRLFDHAEKIFGPVDILINNATGWVQDTFTPSNVDRHGRAMQPVTAATWTQQFAVDAMAPALLIAEFARRHVARAATWGRIVGLTSGGELGFPQAVSYGAAKAAQTNYTMSAAVELAALGITANVVHPPVTDTGWVTDAVRSFVADSPTHVHVATPAQVAEVIAYLASDAASLITGNVLTLR